MQLRSLIKGLVVASMVVLSACSAPKHKGDGQEGVDAYNANGGAQASGVGSGSNFGDQAGGVGGPQASLANRTYYFDYDKSQIHDSDKAAIIANADYLMAHPNAKIILEGHTDPRGSREYNVALGERRADSVLDFMKEKGVNPDQIRVVSYGAQRLAAQGRSESDYQLDRRVVLVYTRG